MIAVKLTSPDSGRFRIGSGDLQSTDAIFHSDTIFNGLISSYNLLYGENETNELLRFFMDKKIKLSSGFYFLEMMRNGKSERCLYFLPRPFMFRKLVSKENDKSDELDRKKLKKLAFLEKSVLQSLLSGVEIQHQQPIFNIDLSEQITFGGEFAIESEEFSREMIDFLANKKFRNNADAPKVAVQRLSGETADVYYQADVQLKAIQFYSWQENGSVYYAEMAPEVIKSQWDIWLLKPGVYFLLEYELSGLMEKKLLSAIRLLGDEGVGGERSTGAGFFEKVEFTDFEWSLSGPFSINLSLVCPDKNESNAIVSYFPLIRGGGYISHSGFRKKRIRLVKEGSVWSGNVAGRLVDVTPAGFNKYRVFHNGLNLSIQFEV